MDTLAERRAAFFASPRPLAPPPLAIPPSGFRPARKVLWAREAPCNPHHTRDTLPPSGAQLAGLRYERRVKDWLASDLGLAFSPGPWWEFFDAERRRYCQPDGIIRRGDWLTIVEIKVRWVVDAVWQLRYLYLPVAQKLFPNAAGFALCSIVRSFDPAIAVPVPIQLLRGIDDAPTTGPIGVYVWRGPRR